MAPGKKRLRFSGFSSHMEAVSHPYQLARLFGLCYKHGLKLNHLLPSGRSLTLAFEHHKLRKPSQCPNHQALIDDLNQLNLHKHAAFNQVDDGLHLTVESSRFASHLLNSLFHQSSLEQFVDNLLDENEKSDRIIIEYSSPNIAKPFHYGHFKSTILGNFIANLLENLGKEVIRLNYLGDCGTQFGLLSLGFSRFGDESKLQTDPVAHLLDVYVKANKEAQVNQDVKVEALSRAKRLEDRSDESLVEEWKRFVKISTDELEKIYSRLGVSFDQVYTESMYTMKAKELVKSLVAQQLVQVCDDGLKVLQVKQPSSDQVTTLILEKSDGTSLYLTRDVCAAIDRKRKYHFNRALYIVDQGQSSHFRSIKTVLKELKYDWHEDIHHVPFGRIAGMSTRKGQSVLFGDIINEAKSLAKQKLSTNKNTKVEEEEFDRVSEVLGISALITHDFRNSRGHNYSFNWNHAMKQDGETGIALQYCHARLHSLERSCMDADDFRTFLDHLSSDASILDKILQSEESRNLILVLMCYGQCLLDCRENLCPQKLSHFLFTLAHSVNCAFRVLKVKNEPDKLVANGHLLLFSTARQLLGHGMRLLGMKPLNAM